MDPLSIIASSITVFAAASATAKTLKKLAGLRKAPNEIWQFHNEVLIAFAKMKSRCMQITDFTVVLSKAHHLELGLKDVTLNTQFVVHLQSLRQRAEGTLNELNDILKNHIVDNYPELEKQNIQQPSFEFSKRAWLKRRTKVQLLIEILERSKAAIHDAADQLANSTVPRSIVCLEELKVLGSATQSNIDVLQAATQDHAAFIQSVVAPTLSQINKSLVQLMPHHEDQLNTELPSSTVEGIGEASGTGHLLGSYVSGMPTIVSNPSNMATFCSDSLGIKNSVVQASRAEMDHPVPENITGTKSLIRARTALYTTGSCEPMCGCQCHLMSTAKLPSWMSQIVGSLFIGYRCVPYLRQRDCDHTTCRRKSEAFIKKGNIFELQNLLSQGKASLYDVSDSEARTALHFALTAKRPDVCAFLLRQRIKHFTEDKNLLSPIDLVWNYLLQDPTTAANVGIREAFSEYLDQAEDLRKRNFTALHKIVFGLSDIDLHEFLSLSTVDIDKRCSLGRTALCWASLRRDPKPVRTLVEFGASIHLADNRGQLPTHFASETGVSESLKVLLAAAARMHLTEEGIPSDQDHHRSCSGIRYETDLPIVSEYCRELLETRDYKGRTALHFATRKNQVEHARMLVQYGANIDSTDLPLGRTPLLLAIYWNSHDIISLLLSNGARTDVVDTRRCTVLHYAARYGDENTLGILLESTILVATEFKDAHDLSPMRAFDCDRNRFVMEEEERKRASRQLFEKLLWKVEENPHEDTDGSGVDEFFDSVSSLEASIVGVKEAVELLAE